MKNFSRKILYALVCVTVILSMGATRTSADTPTTPEAKTILVSTTGTDAADCGTVSKPCQSLQYAVNLAASGDTILVAKGTYTYNNMDPCTAQSTRSVVCIMDKQLTLNGGYSEDNWTVADPINNLTIIDGGSLYRGILVWRVSGTASLNMQGFTVQNGRAVGRPVGNQYIGHGFGGGIWASKSFVNIKNVIFKNNTAVGGSNAGIQLAGWAFGGGLAIEGPSYGGSSTLEKLTFIGNVAEGGVGGNSGGNSLGGGLFTSEAAVTAKEITLTNNISRGGATSGTGCTAPAGGYGGGAAMVYQTNISLSYFTATGNQAIGANASSCGGAGIGGVFFFETATILLTDSILKGNQATGGNGTTGGVGWAGGVYTEKANITLDRTKFIANTATSGSSTGGGKAGPAGGGGALLTAFDSGNYWANITNSLFADNKAVMGAGINGTGGGGGLLVQAVAATITHSTFVNNQLQGMTVGQGVLVIAMNGSSGKAGSANIKYSVFTDHQTIAGYNNSTVQIFAGSTGSLSYVWFGNNKSDTNVPAGTPMDHIWHNTFSAGYISPSAPNYDYHLQADSPVINLATGSTTPIDLDRLPRPVGPASDLGSYEYSVPTLVAEKPVLYFITDMDDIITQLDLISVNTGPLAEWTATTSADWVYLGPSGTSQQTTGQTGTNLTIRFDPSKIALGSYDVTIDLTSLTANPTSITIHFFKVDEVGNAYFPFVSK